MSEKELVKKARNGDKDAFCELYGIYKSRLFNYAFYRLGTVHDAEDAVSECVLSAYQQIKNLKSENAFCVWIFKILYSTCADAIKNQITQRGTENIDNLKNISSADYEKYIAASELKNALGKLDDDEKNIVLLSVIAGFKSKEIAKISGLTAGSVRSKLSRSLAKMKNELEN